MSLDPQQSYVYLAEDGSSQCFSAQTFWDQPPSSLDDAAGGGWLISEFAFIEDWPTWEMHPHADEFVYLLSGAVELQLDYPNGVQTIALRGTGAVVVPRGVWHTAKVKEPSRMLHVTRGAGTETRPAGQA